MSVDYEKLKGVMTKTLDELKLPHTKGAPIITSDVLSLLEGKIKSVDLPDLNAPVPPAEFSSSVNTLLPTEQIKTLEDNKEQSTPLLNPNALRSSDGTPLDVETARLNTNQQFSKGVEDKAERQTQEKREEALQKTKSALTNHWEQMENLHDTTPEVSFGQNTEKQGIPLLQGNTLRSDQSDPYNIPYNITRSPLGLQSSQHLENSFQNTRNANGKENQKNGLTTSQGLVKGQTLTTNIHDAKTTIEEDIPRMEKAANQESLQNPVDESETAPLLGNIGGGGGQPLRKYFEAFLFFLKAALDENNQTVLGAKEWKDVVAEFVDSYLSKFKYRSKKELCLLLDLTLADTLTYNNLENTYNLMNMLENKYKTELKFSSADEAAFYQFKKVIANLVEYMKRDPDQPGLTGDPEQREKFIRDFVDSIYAQDGDAITPGTPMGKSNKGFVESQREQAMSILKGIFDERISIATETAKNPEAKRKLIGTLEDLRAQKKEKERAQKIVQYKLSGLPVPLDTPRDGWDKIVKIMQAELTSRGVPLELEYAQRGGAQPLALLPFQTFVDKLVTGAAFKGNAKELQPLIQNELKKHISEYTDNPTNVNKILENIDLSKYATEIATAIHSGTGANAIAEKVKRMLDADINRHMEEKINSPAFVDDAATKTTEKIRTDDPLKNAIARLVPTPSVEEVAAKITSGLNVNETVRAQLEAKVNALFNKKDDGTSDIEGLIKLDKYVDQIAKAIIKDDADDGKKKTLATALVPQLITELLAQLPDPIVKELLNNENPALLRGIVSKFIEALDINGTTDNPMRDKLVNRVASIYINNVDMTLRTREAIAEQITPEFVNSLNIKDGDADLTIAEYVAKQIITQRIGEFTVENLLAAAGQNDVAKSVKDRILELVKRDDTFKQAVADLVQTGATIDEEAVTRVVSSTTSEITRRLEELNNYIRQQHEDLATQITAIDRKIYELQNNDTGIIYQHKKELEERIAELTTEKGALEDRLTRHIQSYGDESKVIHDITESLSSKYNMLESRVQGIEKQPPGSIENLSKLVMGMLGVTTNDQKIKDQSMQVIQSVLSPERKGGAPPTTAPDAPVAPTPTENAKKQLGTLDQVKKEIRGILNALDTIQGAYTSTYRDLFARADAWTPDQNTGTKTINESSMNLNTKDVTRGNSPIAVAVSKEQQEQLATWKTLQEDGQKWVKEVETTISQKKAAMENVQKLLQSVFDTEPANKKYIDFGTTVKVLFEGNYQINVAAKMEEKSAEEKKKENEAKGLLTLLQSIVQDAKSEYENAARKLKPLALAVEESIKLEKERIQAEGRRRLGGGSVGGGFSDSSENIEYIKKQLNDVILQNIVKELDSIYLRQSNPVMAAAVSEPSIFAGLYNDYLDRRNKVGSFVASQELAQQMRNNALIPREVLAVSKLDKTVFVFVTLFIRLFALTIAEYMIERGVINTMPKALGAFVGLYLLIFVLFVLMVNLDIYRMRIVFNYVNFHANAGLVYSHIGMLVLFTIIIYIIMRNVNFPIKGMEIKAITEEEKSNLIYRMELLTMIVWLFLVIVIVVMK